MLKQSRWSPADLDRQRLVVRRIAVRADTDLRELGAARDRLVADVRSRLTSPLTLIGCFVAGVMVRRRKVPQRLADAPPRSGHWLVRAAVVLRALVLGAPAYRAFVRSVVTSPHTNAASASDEVAR